MYTRQQYINGECTHEQYYDQFVTESIKSQVEITIGLKSILNSTDVHFNDIELRQWDHFQYLLPSSVSYQLKKCGDYFTLAGAVCIAKAAARQIKQENQ